MYFSQNPNLCARDLGEDQIRQINSFCSAWLAESPLTQPCSTGPWDFNMRFQSIVSIINQPAMPATYLQKSQKKHVTTSLHQTAVGNIKSRLVDEFIRCQQHCCLICKNYLSLIGRGRPTDRGAAETDAESKRSGIRPPTVPYYKRSWPAGQMGGCNKLWFVVTIQILASSYYVLVMGRWCAFLRATLLLATQLVDITVSWSDAWVHVV